MNFIVEHVDGVVFVYICIAALLDLFLRGVAFGRVESIAIDIGIFSVLYSSLRAVEKMAARRT